MFVVFCLKGKTKTSSFLFRTRRTNPCKTYGHRIQNKNKNIIHMSLIIVLPKIVDFIAMEDDDDDVLAIVSFFYRRSVCWSCIREIIKNLLQMDDMVRFEEWLIFSSMVGDDVIHCYGLWRISGNEEMCCVVAFEK